MTYIFESPDGGQTIYRRRPGQTQRELHSITEQKRKWDQQVAEEMLWVKILQASRNNPALQDAVERVKIIYALGHND